MPAEQKRAIASAHTHIHHLRVHSIYVYYAHLCRVLHPQLEPHLVSEMMKLLGHLQSSPGLDEGS